MVEADLATELSVVMLGSTQKAILFQKLCQAAAKYERHASYQDVHYLTVDCDGKQEVIEFNDPGLARTGGREMAIKRADLALLFYSALSLRTLEQLQTLKEDLEMKSNIPLRLVCDSDEAVEEEEDGGSTGISSVSEGYESDPEREGHVRRRNSMEKMRKVQEDNGVAVEQGQQWANKLGPNCEFIQLSSSQFADGRIFLEDLIRAIRNTRKSRNVSLIKRLRQQDKTSPRCRDKSNEKLSPRKSRSLKGSSVSSDTSESAKSVKRTFSEDVKTSSKVCVIM